MKIIAVCAGRDIEASGYGTQDAKRSRRRCYARLLLRDCLQCHRKQGGRSTARERSSGNCVRRRFGITERWANVARTTTSIPEAEISGPPGKRPFHG